MAPPVCCVCDTPVAGKAYTVGGRTFCERHYTQITNNRQGMWGATLVMIVVLVLFEFIVGAVAPMVAPSLRGGALVFAGVVLALVPAALWMVVFYLQDRAEPEPKEYLFGVFGLGALLASAVGQPLITQFFRVSDWATGSVLLRLGAGVLVVGTIQEFLKYAAVRYSIFNSPEFDERIDGIIYGAAAGLGYATMLNITYVVNNGGVDLAVGATRIAVSALAHASFAGISGYFLGRAKFENMGPLWLPAGLFLAALLNGVVTVALGAISRSGLQATPLNGLILAAGIAIVTFGTLFMIMRRNNQALTA